MKFFKKFFSNEQTNPDSLNPADNADNIEKDSNVDKHDIDKHDINKHNFEKDLFDFITNPEIAEQFLHKPVAQVIFSILPDGNVHVGYIWEKDDIAKPYGALLHKINSGEFMHEMIGMLLENAHNQPEQQQTIHQILEEWKKLHKNSTVKPIISPLEALRTGGNNEVSETEL